MHSSAVEHGIADPMVASSILAAPFNFRAYGVIGSASDSKSEGWGFDSLWAHIFFVFLSPEGNKKKCLKFRKSKRVPPLGFAPRLPAPRAGVLLLYYGGSKFRESRPFDQVPHIPHQEHVPRINVQCNVNCVWKLLELACARNLF